MCTEAECREMTTSLVQAGTELALARDLLWRQDVLLTVLRTARDELTGKLAIVLAKLMRETGSEERSDLPDGVADTGFSAPLDHPPGASSGTPHITQVSLASLA